jgi:hypothetical protein
MSGFGRAAPRPGAGVAHADHTLKDFQDARAAGGAKWQEYQQYLQGVGDGFERALRRPLPTGELRPQPDTWIGKVLMLGLMKVFPCPNPNDTLLRPHQ